MYRILELNPQLMDFQWDIDLRMQNYWNTKNRLLGEGQDKKASQVLSTSFFTAFGIGTLLLIFGNIFTGIPAADMNGFTITVTDGAGVTVYTGSATLGE